MARLVLFFLMIYLVAFFGFWLLGMIYGLLRRPPVWFPARLAATMAIVGLAGSLLLGVGGVVFSTMVMNSAFAKRDDYRAVPVVIAGAVLSSVVLFGTLLSAYLLAWEVLE